MKIQSIEPLSYQLLHETQYRMYTTAQQQITLYVIFEGKVNFSFSQEDVIVEENQGLFLAGGTQFTLMMYGEHIDGFKTVFSFAKGSESYRIFRDAFSFGRPFPISFVQGKLLDSMREMRRTAPDQHFGAENHILTAFFQSVQRMPVTGPKSDEVNQRNLTYVKEAIEYISSHLYEPLHLEDVADRLCLGEHHLIRIFKQITGLTPFVYYNRLRVNRACILLISTNLSVNEIADSLAFSDASHFIRMFKKLTALTPAKYRQQYLYSYEEFRCKSKEYKEDSYNLLETIIDASPDLIFYKDRDRILQGCNQAFCNIMGLEKSQIIGKTDWMLFPKEEAAFYYQKDSFVLKTGKPQRNIEWMCYPDGVARRFQVFKAPYYNKEGKIIGLVGISRDITDMSSLGETGSNP